jgi:hypothetical protein
MDLLLAICQAIGLALAVGVGGPAAALFITVMAYFHVGIDPRGTNWDFLGKIWFLFLVLISTAVALSLARSEDGPRRLARLGFATVFGAIAGAASLAEQGDSAVFGLVIGALVGAGSGIVATDVLIGARRRAELSNLESKASAGNTLEGIFALAGILIALLALFVPPLSLLGIVALGVLANGRRRKADEKYEGLRVLR